jgi:Preprotein translocase subunit SecA (ATPase, RNA helicase)
MIKSILDAMFKGEDRSLQRWWKQVKAINALEPEMQALSDEDLKARTADFKDRVAKGAKLDSLVVPAFATMREAARRVIGQRHYDVQLIGGMVLNDRSIAEMRTGEGKTLVATLAAYLGALEGKGVHVVTVNDYLARRDHALMAPVHEFLGLTVGLVVPDMERDARRAAYACDITYVTNSEVGFDHLRDNLETERSAMVQRGFHYAIVDEVDSVLIDEARTPLVISGPAQDNARDYQVFDRFVPRVPPGEYEIDEKERTVNLTEAGMERMEKMLRTIGILKEGHLYDPSNSNIFHHVTAALRAHKLFQRDRHYIVNAAGEVVLVDESTGRPMPGRRLNEGLHQALEAKERVAILPESQTVAAVTYQNFFRGYKRLSGMTGTARTEAEEFSAIYDLPVVRVPTHRPVLRKDLNDEIYRTAAEKTDAIVKEIGEAHARLQPVLVGTSSIEKSEQLALALAAAGYTRADLSEPGVMAAMVAKAVDGEPSRMFTVLNARHNATEAEIVSQAGLPGAITIATNMAGRGTDIQLGGNPETLPALLPEGADAEAVRESLQARSREAGGLYVIGTERHESRRIDNQLRGRSGRQGDPGRSKFFLSLEDDLLRIFGGIGKLVEEIEPEPGQAIAHPLVDKMVQRAQTRLEAHNFNIRKQVVQFDDVVNQQRLAVLREREEIMDAPSMRSIVDHMRHETVGAALDAAIPPRSYPEQWDIAGLAEALLRDTGLDAPLAEWAAEEGIDEDGFRQRVMDAADARYEAHASAGGEEHGRLVERQFVLRILDAVWQDHIADLDHLKQVVGWRAIGQRDPISEFRQDASDHFDRAVLKWYQLVTREVSRNSVPAAGSEAA